MDVVAHARAVRRRVVVTEDLQFGTLTDRDLGDKGHQVVRNAARILADEA